MAEKLMAMVPLTSNEFFIVISIFAGAKVTISI
jgi:hypothetical protein